MGASTEPREEDGREHAMPKVPLSERGPVEPMLCDEHGEIPADQRPWLPKIERGDLAPHIYCPECGEVKARGGASGLDRGGLVNLVSRLEDLLEREGHVVTEVQKRLILKRLTKIGADDGYGLNRGRQLELVAEVAGPMLGLPEEVVHSYLRSI